jgi:hypothetical protein
MTYTPSAGDLLLSERRSKHDRGKAWALGLALGCATIALAAWPVYRAWSENDLRQKITECMGPGYTPSTIENTIEGVQDRTGASYHEALDFYEQIACTYGPHATER